MGRRGSGFGRPLSFGSMRTRSAGRPGGISQGKTESAAEVLCDQAIDEGRELFAGFGRTKAFAAESQSSLKLVESAEIQICRTGVLGVMTNLPGGSSKSTLSTPFWASTSNPARSSSSRASGAATTIESAFG